MLFQENNTRLQKRKVMGDGDEWGGTVRYARPLSYCNRWSEVDVVYIDLCSEQPPHPPNHTHVRIYTVYIYIQTYAHTPDLLRSPGNHAASEQPSVTHSSKNKPGSCENKAWEPWNLGVVKGMGSPVVCRAKGTLTGFSWWAREHKVTRAEAKGGGSRPLSQQPVSSGAENTACLPCSAVFPINNAGELWAAAHRSDQEPGSNAYIHCDSERMPQVKILIAAYQ